RDPGRADPHQGDHDPPLPAPRPHKEDRPGRRGAQHKTGGRWRAAMRRDRRGDVINGLDGINFPPRNEGAEGYVYVVGSGARVKIGWSRHPFARLTDLQAASPHMLLVYRIVPCADSEIEKRLHRRFASQRTHGEWFEVRGALHHWLLAGCPIKRPLPIREPHLIQARPPEAIVSMRDLRVELGVGETTLLSWS